MSDPTRPRRRPSKAKPSPPPAVSQALAELGRDTARRREYLSRLRAGRDEAMEVRCAVEQLFNSTSFVERITGDAIARWTEYCTVAAGMIGRLGLAAEVAESEADDRAARAAKAVLRAVIDGGPSAAGSVADHLFADAHHRQVLGAFRDIAGALYGVQYARSDREIARLYPDIEEEQRAEARRLAPWLAGDPLPAAAGRTPNLPLRQEIYDAVSLSPDPLQGGQIAKALHRDDNGHLRRALSWMVKNGELTKVPNEGYGPGRRPA